MGSEIGKRDWETRVGSNTGEQYRCQTNFKPILLHHHHIIIMTINVRTRNVRPDMFLSAAQKRWQRHRERPGLAQDILGRASLGARGSLDGGIKNVRPCNLHGSEILGSEIAWHRHCSVHKIGRSLKTNMHWQTTDVTLM